MPSPQKDTQGLFNPLIFVILGLVSVLAFSAYTVYRADGRSKAVELRKLELEHTKSVPTQSGEALTQNGGKLESIQQGNVSYFYQVNPTNGLRIPLPDYKVMLNAFESTARLVGPVVSIAPEITPYNGKMAYMGMWVSFMPKPLENLSR